MSDALYERYKDALRRGHVAALRGRHDAALAAYGEAAKLAPDRPLPLVGIGNVLAGLGKHTEALAAFDAAIERAPADEAALRGRADVLITSGDRTRAAEALDRLSSALDANGRHSDALDAARRALELAESRSRRAGVKAMVAHLTQTGAPGDPTVSETLSRALGILEDRVMGRGKSDAPASADEAAIEAPPGPTPEPQVPAEPEPEPEPEPPPPLPFDPVAAIAAVEDSAAAGDATATRDLALAAAEGYLAAGQRHVAIHVCYMALATNPADPGLHLTLAGLYLDLGWRATAVEKLALLARLAELGDDAETRTRLCTMITDRRLDEPLLAKLCA